MTGLNHGAGDVMLASNFFADQRALCRVGARVLLVSLNILRSKLFTTALSLKYNQSNTERKLPAFSCALSLAKGSVLIYLQA